MAETEDAGGDESELGPDEAFCTSCGETIKAEAEVCPNCGVRQQEADQEGGGSGMAESRKYELQKIARKDKTTAAIVGFLISPVGYLMVGKTGLAIINFFTLNYFLLGVIIVPLHVRSIIQDAREQLERSGEQW